MFWVYIVENPAGKLYVGQTNDPDRRLVEHNNPDRGSGKYTHKNRPWQLVHIEEYASRAEAVQRERFIKSRKSATWIRVNLIGTASPDVHRD